MISNFSTHQEQERINLLMAKLGILRGGRKTAEIL
jgi:hypothetical protein